MKLYQDYISFLLNLNVIRETNKFILLLFYSQNFYCIYPYVHLFALFYAILLQKKNLIKKTFTKKLKLKEICRYSVLNKFHSVYY